MNHMGYVTHLQGRYDPAMATLGGAPLVFTVPPSGHVLLMAQATALSAPGGSHEVGVVFTLFDNSTTLRGHGTGIVKGLNPGHATVCMIYFTVSGLPPSSLASITVDTWPGSAPGGGIGPEDYYSVAVVELEQSVEKQEGGPEQA